MSGRYWGTLLLVVALALTPGCDKKKTPSSKAWAGSVTRIDKLNGMSLTVSRGDTRVEGMREGSAIPPGTLMETQPGVSIDLALEGGGEAVVDGATKVSLDRYEARRAHLERGRLFVTSGTKPAELELAGKVVRLGMESAIVAEAHGDRGSVAVVRGVASIGGEKLTGGQAAKLGPNEGETIEPFIAWDMESRTSWLRRDPNLVGYGELRDDSGDFGLTDHLVEATVTASLADTVVVEGFINRGEEPQVLKYAFSLPEGAVPIELAIRQTGEWVVGKIAERGKARAEFDEAQKEERQALLMKVDDGVAILETGEVAPGEAISFRIRYVQELASTHGGMQYRYEMPWDREADLRAERFRLRANLTGLSADRVRTFGYDVGFESDQGSTTATFEAGDFVPTGSFVLDIDAEHDGVVVREKRGDETFVALTLRPDFKTPTATEPTDLVIAVDTSRSQSSEAHREAHASLVKELAEALPEATRLHVMACSDQCIPVTSTEGFVSVRTMELSALDEVESSGPTNISEIVRVSERLFEKWGSAERRKRVLYLGDAIATTGPLSVDTIDLAGLEKMGVALHVATFEKTGHNADELAVAGGGAALELPFEPDEKLTKRLVSQLTSSALLDLEVKLPEGLDEPLPVVVNSLQQGESVTIFARAKPSTRVDSVVVKGQIDGEAFSQVLGLELIGTLSPVVSSTWAARRISTLEKDGDRPQAHLLSQQYGVQSGQTSFVATERRAEPVARAAPSPSPEVVQERRKIRQKRKKKPSPKFKIATQDSLIDPDYDPWRDSNHRAPRYARTARKSKEPAALPSRSWDRVAIGPVRVEGDVDRHALWGELWEERDAIRTCLQYGRQYSAPWASRVELQVTISSEGKIADVTAKGYDSEDLALRCLERRTGTFSTLARLAKTVGEFSFEVEVTLRTKRNPVTLIDTTDNQMSVSLSAGKSVSVAAGLEYPGELFQTAFLAQPRTVDEQSEAALALGMIQALGKPTAHQAFVLDGFHGGAESALARVIHEIEMKWAQPHEYLDAAALETHPGRACALRQAAAERGGEEPMSCPPASDLPWLDGEVSQGAPPATSKPEGPLSLTLSVSGSGGQNVMLVDLDGKRRWRFEPGDDTRCSTGPAKAEAARKAKKSVVTTCKFYNLPNGLYGVQALPAKSDTGRNVVALTIERADQAHTIMVAPRDPSIDATVAIGDVELEAPEVTLSGPDGWSRVEQTLSSARPIIAHCHLPGRLPNLYSMTVKNGAGGKVAIVKQDADGEVARCITSALGKLRLRPDTSRGGPYEVAIQMFDPVLSF